MHGLTVAIQMDHASALIPEMDTTLLLAREAQARGCSLLYYTPDTLSLDKEGVRAAVRPMRILEGATGVEMGDAHAFHLAQADVVLMRQDPPMDMAYMSATYLLERLDGTLVLNDPAEVRNAPEKLIPFQFPDFMPPTLVTASVEDIRSFHREHGDIVLKPLYDYSGRSVFRVARDGMNLTPLLEMLLFRREPLVAQCFLPEVHDQEVRVVMIDGKIAGCFGRIPPPGEIRSNIHAGGKAVRAELTSLQRQRCEAIGTVLSERNLILAGIDFIGEWLIEVNVTSPGGIRQLQHVYSHDHSGDFWDAVERRL